MFPARSGCLCDTLSAAQSSDCMAPPLATQPIALDALLHLLYSRVLKTLGALGSKLVIQLVIQLLFIHSLYCYYLLIIEL